jgi:hypothetical protein
LFNMYGEAIGITYAGLQSLGGENLNFAIPINEAKPYLNPQAYVPLQSVFIQQVKPNTNAIDTIKIYSKIQNEYRQLSLLGEGVKSLSNNFSLAFNEINISRKSTYLNTVLKYLNDEINYKNSEIEIVTNTIKKASEVGLITTDMNDILQYYYDSLEYYKVAYEGLSRYSYSMSDVDFNSYLQNSQAAFDNSFEGIKKADMGYRRVYDLIQNYKYE